MFDQVPLILAQEDAAPAPAAPMQNTAGEKALPPPGTAGADPNASGKDPQKTSGAFPMEMIYVFLLVMVVMMIFSSRSRKKERKNRDKMIASLNKGMKVKTIGGIVGSVVEVRDNIVILKVDENANIRIKFTRSAIQSVTEEKDDE